MTLTTAGPAGPGIDWQAIILTQMGLRVEPEIVIRNDPDAHVNLAISPSIGMLPPQSVNLQVAPRIGMEYGTVGEAEFNVAVTPSFGMNNTPKAAFNLDAEPGIFMGMHGGSDEPGRFAVTLAPALAMAGAGVAPSVLHDATGAGSTTSVVTSISWSHTASTGALVLAAIAQSTASDAPTNVKYGTSSMTLVGSAPMNNTGYGAVYVYKLASAPGGAQTISASFPSATYASGCSVSYLNVGSVGTPATVYGNSSSASQAVTQSQGGMVFQAFGTYTATITAASGGTSRYLSGSGYASLAIQDSAALSPTFSATLSAATPWGGIAVPLIS